MEKWKAVESYEGYYRVSNYGRVRSLDRIVVNHPSGHRKIIGRVLKCSVDNTGYRRVNLSMPNRKVKNALVHRLIANAFIDNPENKPGINHLDGDKANNSLSNLQWCTHKENMKHAFDTGLTPRYNNPKGESGISAKLTDAQVVDIKVRLANGEHQTSIAKDYTVGASTIGEIKAGRSWSHIDKYAISRLQIALPQPGDEE